MVQQQNDEGSTESVNVKRLETIREVCRRNNKTNSSLEDISKLNIIVNEKYKILFCYIPKIACTQWKTVIASLSGPQLAYPGIHDARNFKFLSNYPTDEVKRMLKTYFKFVFVREPFERLLSAYLDKFQSGDPAFHKNYGQRIITLYRPGGNPEEKNVKFDEFLNYVLHLGDGYWNEHWQTYDNLCQPCGIPYDFIGHFENLGQEAQYVLEISGVTKKANVSFPPVKRSQTSSLVPFFYNQIHKERLYGTMQLFGPDSEMFGYDLPKSFYEIIPEISQQSRTRNNSKQRRYMEGEE
ncbi:carbohydrate sulfotransferase 11-like [Stylophora pistillata]|uniref:carbohydrate sulfotransferase 11-like n=1 Tax=Stylophora pistillata TaxID=50429 RepID=UPI000C03939D|nr:carbohydrate sulfotransferase 11-like [Stylophora pistillata]